MSRSLTSLGEGAPVSDQFDPRNSLRAARAREHEEELRLLAGTLLQDDHDRLMKIRNSLKAMPKTTNKRQSIALSEELVLRWRSTNVRHNLNDAMARKNATSFTISAGAIVTRMPGDVYRFEFGLKRLFLTYTTKAGWRVQSHEGFVNASGRTAGARTRGAGPDASIER